MTGASARRALRRNHISLADKWIGTIVLLGLLAVLFLYVLRRRRVRRDGARGSRRDLLAVKEDDDESVTAASDADDYDSRRAA